MSVYKVHFKWKDKEIALKAKSLDMTHPYFVSIKDLIFEEGSKLIIDPMEDEVRHRFGSAEHIMIPFQAVSLIEEFSSREKIGNTRSFKVVEREAKKKKT